MEKAVQHGGDGGTIAEQFSPVLNRTVRRHERAHAFVTAHDDLQQLFRRCGPSKQAKPDSLFRAGSSDS